MRWALILGGILLSLGGRALAADIPLKAPYYYYPERNWTGTYVGFSGAVGGGNLRGGQAAFNFGINFQTYSQFVFGAEVDLSFGRLTGEGNCPGCEFENRWLTTARARAGYMFGRTLLFVTGGLASGNIRATGIAGAFTDDIKTGYAVGAGVEFDLRQNWSLRSDYLHVDLGKINCDACGIGAPQFRGTSELFKVGLIYRFFQEEVNEYNVLGPPIRPPPF